jgi:hypothetical protein
MEFHAAVTLSSKITRKLLLTSEKSVAFFTSAVVKCPIKYQFVALLKQS